MTVRVQGIVYWVFFFWILLVGLTVTILGIYVVMSEDFSIAVLATRTAIPSNQMDTVFGSGNILRVILTSAGCFLISVSASIVFLRFFKQISDSRLLFFFIFFFSLSFELMKPFSLFSGIFVIPESLRILFSQFALGGYLTGLFGIFFMSLYQLGIEYQHQGIVLLLNIILSVIITALVPMNTFILSQNFLYPPADRGQVLWMVFGVITITMIGYIIHSRSNKTTIIGMFSVLFLMSGHVFIHFSSDPLISIASVGMLIGGTVIYFIQLFRDLSDKHLKNEL